MLLQFTTLPADIMHVSRRLVPLNSLHLFDTSSAVSRRPISLVLDFPSNWIFASRLVLPPRSTCHSVLRRAHLLPSRVTHCIVPARGPGVGFVRVDGHRRSKQLVRCPVECVPTGVVVLSLHFSPSQTLTCLKHCVLFDGPLITEIILSECLIDFFISELLTEISRHPAQNRRDPDSFSCHSRMVNTTRQ